MEYIPWWYVHATAIAAIFALWFYWKFVTILDYWQKKGAIYLKPIPVFGNVKDAILMKTPEAIMYEKLYWELDGKPYGGVFHLTKPCLLVRDPEIIKDVMVKHFSSFHDRGFSVDEKLQPLSAHLFHLGGTKWRNLRVKLTPTFTSGKIKMMFPIIVENANLMLTNLECSAIKSETVEMKEVIAQLTTDIIGSCAFGLQINSLNNSNSEFRKFGRDLLSPSLLLKLHFLSLQYLTPLKPLLAFIQSKKLNFFINVVRDMVKYREEKKITRNDFLQLLIQLKNKEVIEIDSVYSKEDEFLMKNSLDVIKEDGNTDEVFTDTLLAAQCFIFFIGGFETASTTASYAIYELAQNQEIQERLRKDVDDTLKKNNGNMTYDALQKMKYLEQIVDETLRKYPPLGKLDRICTMPYKILGTDVVVDKGTRLAIPVYAIHHDPKYYPDPERFDPDRFTAENKSSRPQYVYLPFGEGPRICIGMRFGLVQTKMALAALISKYKFTVSSKTVIPPVFDANGGLVLSARDGIWLKICERSK